MSTTNWAKFPISDRYIKEIQLKGYLQEEFKDKNKYKISMQSDGYIIRTEKELTPDQKAGIKALSARFSARSSQSQTKNATSSGNPDVTPKTKDPPDTQTQKSQSVTGQSTPEAPKKTTMESTKNPTTESTTESAAESAETPTKESPKKRIKKPARQSTKGPTEVAPPGEDTKPKRHGSFIPSFWRPHDTHNSK